MRIRVQMDITKPLRRKLKMKKEGGEPFLVEFKYERLLNFCFLCGVIGHTERFCHLLFEGGEEETVRPYGSWIRASGRRPMINAGAQWLISDDNERKVTKPVQSKEVEMVESDNSTQPGYEVREMHSAIEIRDQEIRNLDAFVNRVGRDKTIEQCVYNMLGKPKANGPDFESGLEDVDQKRKRAARYLGQTDANMVNTSNLDVSKISPEVGSAGQAHLDQ